MFNRIKIFGLRILGWKMGKDLSQKEKGKITELGKKIDFREINIPRPKWWGKCPECGKRLSKQIVSVVFGSIGAPAMGIVYFKCFRCTCGYKYATAIWGEGCGDFGPLKFVPPKYLTKA